MVKYVPCFAAENLKIEYYRGTPVYFVINECYILSKFHL